jgi:hypothetical protein
MVKMVKMKMKVEKEPEVGRGRLGLLGDSAEEIIQLALHASRFTSSHTATSATSAAMTAAPLGLVSPHHHLRPVMRNRND